MIAEHIKTISIKKPALPVEKIQFDSKNKNPAKYIPSFLISIALFNIDQPRK